MLKKLAFVLLLSLVSATSMGVLALAGPDTGMKVIAEVEGLR